MRFEFATSTRIVFGPGTLAEAAPAVRACGTKALVTVGKSAARAQKFLDALEAEGVTAGLFHVDGEPDIETIEAGLRQARAQGCEVVVGFGGGSVLDTGKAVAALLTNPGRVRDYLEGAGEARALIHASAPFVAIPTTSGTGSEVTRNAVLAVPDAHVKVSLRSPLMLPRVAIVDPELTYGLPPEVTATSGMDALTQLIEPFVSNAANPLVDGFCREGMSRAARALHRAFESDDRSAREDMSLASLLSGLALANARLGAVHAFAGPLGGLFSAPHGALCARLLPAVMEANLKALAARAPQSTGPARFAEVAQIITGNSAAKAEDGIVWLQELSRALKIPPLAAHGIKAPDFPAIVSQAKKANSMKGNPIALTDDELMEILERAK